MSKISLALKSRTFWTIVVLFVINGVQGISASIPSGWLSTINVLLGLAATYFHVNPSQNYTAPTAPSA